MSASAPDYGLQLFQMTIYAKNDKECIVTFSGFDGGELPKELELIAIKDAAQLLQRIYYGNTQRLRETKLRYEPSKRVPAIA